MDIFCIFAALNIFAMRLELYNINKIKSALVDIEGLTLIAGNNDTGKSTVGKMLFSLIKSISRKGDDLEENLERDVFSLIDKIYFTLRRNIEGEGFDLYLKLFFPPDFLEEIKLLVSFGEEHYVRDDAKLDLLLNERREYILNLQMPNQHKLKLIAYVDDLYLLCKEGLKDSKNLFIQALKSTLHSEFQSDICSKESESSRIILTEGDNFSLDIDLEGNSIERVSHSGNIKSLDDITFIETPLYLQLSDLIERSRTLLDRDETDRRFRPRVPLHVKDLVNKLGLSRYEIIESNEFIELINDIIDGYFVYDRQKNQYIYVQKGNKPILISNVASGIKSFGIIQLLLQVRELNERKMLVIDEPENHLHPEWQLKFAHLVVLLVKHGVPVLLSTHSPYFIQALKVYSQKEDISSMVNYYLAEEEESGMTTISNVNDDLNRVFVKLAEPLNKLMSML